MTPSNGPDHEELGRMSQPESWRPPRFLLPIERVHSEAYGQNTSNKVKSADFIFS